MILVISGGGVRGFYAMGVLKALEDLGYYEYIKSVYGVSVGSIIGAFWLSGFSAEEIFHKFHNLNLLSVYQLDFPAKSILKNKFFRKFFKENLPESFDKLDKKFFIGATDIKTGRFELFEEGELWNILLGSMAIPGIFPPVNYQESSLIDGGVRNNFPVRIARENNPNSKIIGVALNRVSETPAPKNIFDVLGKSWELMMGSSTLENMDEADVLFYPDLELNIIDFRKKLMKETFQTGYKECLEKLG